MHTNVVGMRSRMQEKSQVKMWQEYEWSTARLARHTASDAISHHHLP